MFSLALKMLIGDRLKFLSLIFGLCFASFIVTQQAAILAGIVKETYGFITDTSQPNIWVMDPTVQYIDDIKPLRDTDLYRVRDISGVEWAAPLFKGTIQVRTHNGTFQTCILIGIDDATLIGGPPVMIKGQLEDLRRDDAVIVDKFGARTKLASMVDGRLVPLTVGDVLEINDNRAYVSGICKVTRNFESKPVIYTTYERATYFVPSQRKLLSFIIVRSEPGVNPQELCERIRASTGLAAYTAHDLKWLTVKYYIQYTGIFLNFGFAILLGFIVGTAIVGQTLYNFTIDHLPYFAIFKAMGAVNSLLILMVLLQTFFVTLIGWGIGMGLAALFGFYLQGSELSFDMPLYLYLISGFSIMFISLFASIICIKKLIVLDPAIVFKG
jgi:putative ABC transport system permease protein